MLQPFSTFVAASYRVKFADQAWEIAGARALRRAVFCAEQKIFEDDDTDGVDGYALPIVAVDVVAGEPHEVVGAVRIHEEAPGLWWGSRLAVAPRYRRMSALGSGLIKVAVGSARARGCRRFLAHVQAQNRPLFERLDWRALEPVELFGRPHWLMQAELAAYPMIAEPRHGIDLHRQAA